MMKFKLIFSALCLAALTNLHARPLNLADKRLQEAPPRIIRTCCSFGVDLKVAAIPFIRYNDITGRDLIGPHTFLGSKHEGNGIIYTHKGGFVDIGHLRDQADWTAYIYDLIVKNKKSGNSLIVTRLGYEGGQKILKIFAPDNLTEQDLIKLSGRVAYDLSVWHEIGTWNGTSLIPMVPERYSAFSVEDGYSNLLGIRLGIEALNSDLPFEEAMTKLINETLDQLQALPLRSQTYDAMMEVEGNWWSNRVKLPSGKVIKKRQFELYPCVAPSLLNEDLGQTDVASICLPELTAQGDPNQYYRLEIQHNGKFPIKEIFPGGKKFITQKDFPLLIQYAANESITKYDTLVYKEAKTKNKDNRRPKI
ncbi:MAG: DUF4056 domain-containing protein [Saprospiraceae bacterium]|nr:DUF4056 domain-containing protein [Saprospiraceae bacterium]